MWFLLALLLFTSGAMGADGQPVQNPTETERIHVMHEQMLYPVVLIDVGNGGGSGTVIRSAKNETGQAETYILTNFHVVESAVKVAMEWDPVKKEDVKKETRSPIDASWFIYNQLSRSVGTIGKVADIVAYDRTIDLALLKSRDVENLVPYVAKIAAADTPLVLFEEVWAVGAGLGQPPFPTQGMLSNLDTRISGDRYIFSSAPIIFGNSGGALFYRTKDGYEVIGVPAKMSGAYGTPISHMAYSIPHESIHLFLKNNEMEWLIQ